jgi:hypothetical protein
MTQVYPRAKVYDRVVEFVFPYVPAMVEALKRVPAHARNYDPATKVWMVREPYVRQALDHFKRYFPHAMITDGGARHSAPPPPPPTAPVASPHATLFLLPSAPLEVIEAAYKALVKLHHPDRLPEPEKATGNATLARINVAYAQITAGRRAS